MAQIKNWDYLIYEEYKWVYNIRKSVDLWLGENNNNNILLQQELI